MRGPLLATLCLTPAAAAADCGALVAVRGDGPAAEAVRATLAEDGPADAGCLPLAAEVEPAGDLLAVRVRSVDGRGDAWRVHDVTTAVALIESWSRADLEAPLLVPHTAPLAPPPEPRATPVYVGGLIASSLASDDSLWFDATVNACAELGPFCLGGLLRASFDTAEFGASEHVETNRVGLDLMATAELPIAIAGTTLAPGISLGGGWLRSISDVDATPDPREIDRGTMRFGAQLRLSAPAGERVFIDTGAFVDLLPLAHTTEFVDGGVTLAGEPRWFARLGFGVRYAVQP